MTYCLNLIRISLGHHENYPQYHDYPYQKTSMKIKNNNINKEPVTSSTKSSTLSASKLSTYLSSLVTLYMLFLVMIPDCLRMSNCICVFSIFLHSFVVFLDGW